MPDNSYDIIVKVDQPTSTCLIETPYNRPDLDWVLNAIRAAALKLKLDPQTIGEGTVGSVVPADIIEQTRSARLVVAVCNVPQNGGATEPNPNVMYETGLAFAIGKPALVLRVKGSKLPFDIDAIGGLEYSPADGENLLQNIQDRMRRLLDEMKDQQLLLTRAGAPHVLEVHGGRRVFVEPQLWKSFVTVFRYGHSLQTEMQEVYHKYACPIKKIEEEIVLGKSTLGSLPASRFRQPWKEYTKHYKENTTDILREPSGLPEGLKYLSEIGDAIQISLIPPILRRSISILQRAHQAIDEMYEGFVTDPENDERRADIHQKVDDFVRAVNSVRENSRLLLDRLVELTGALVEPVGLPHD